MKNKDYIIYTDGGYSMKHDEGASAYVILKDGIIAYKKAFKVVEETNQRAELKAIIGAIMELPKNGSAKIFTDSQYAIGVLSNPSWNPKKNLDLIEMFREEERHRNLSLEFEWVKGHSGNVYNEMCDRMCDECVGYDLNAEFAIYKR